MARLSTPRSGVTFVLSAAVLAAFLAAPVAQASGVENAEAVHLAHARQHGRMIRKRAPLFGIGDGDHGNGLGDHGSSTTSATDTQTASGPGATSTTSSGDFWDTLTGLLGGGGGPTSTVTSTSSIASTTSEVTSSSFSINATTTSTSSLALNTTSTTSSTTSTTSSVITTSTPPPEPGRTSTVIVAASGSSSSAQPSTTGDPSAAATKGVAVARKTIVALVAIAGSVGLAFLIWTGIRKWKFRPSSRFEDRMQDPINWNPTNAAYDTSDPATRIEAHRRNGSTGSHGSFGSSEMTHHNAPQPVQYNSYGATGMGATGVTRSVSGRTTSSDHHQNNGALPPLPPHDFTASGNGGMDAYNFYHNRGGQYPAHGAASPPQMVENGLTRGGSLTRPVSMRSENPYDGLDDDYEQHSNLPPHHGGAYGAPPAAPPSYRTGY